MTSSLPPSPDLSSLCCWLTCMAQDSHCRRSSPTLKIQAILDSLTAIEDAADPPLPPAVAVVETLSDGSTAQGS